MDINILFFLQDNLRCEFLDNAMRLFSEIGNFGLIWFVIAFVMMFNKKTRFYGIVLIVSMGVGWLVGDVCVKPLVCRVRPCNLYEINMNIPAPSDYSFPSGHTASSFSSAYVIFKMNNKYGILAYVLAALIGFSRMYNFVHYPSDVLVGAVLGTVIAVIICILAEKRFHNRIA